jgi:hypothetical protein
MTHPLHLHPNPKATCRKKNRSLINYDGVVVKEVVRHLGNNAVSVVSRASVIHLGGGVNGGGVGDNTASVPSGASMIVIGGDFSGGDVGVKESI